jgi:hypothetical protein
MKIIQKIYISIIIIIIGIGCAKQSSRGMVHSGNQISNSLDMNQKADPYKMLPKELILVPAGNSIEKAIQEVLINGVPGSRQQKALIPIKEQESFLKSDAYKYISNNANRFISTEFSTGEKVAVNLHLLRQYLESENILKPFGI